MKKLVLMFVAIAAISFASCGNKNESATPAQDTTDTTAVQDSSATPDSTNTADSASVNK